MTQSRAQPGDPGAHRVLTGLRSEIDAPDHDLLQLIGRRNDLVTQIAAYKRHHRLPIRDPQREREILSDRRQRATPLDPPQTRGQAWFWQGNQPAGDAGADWFLPAGRKSVE